MCECRSKINFISLCVLIYAVRSTSAYFATVKCAKDTEPSPKRLSGVLPMTHFGWLGVLQHAFYRATKVHYAITTGILIHPGFVLTSAEDISKIPPEHFSNNTKYIVWSKDGNKHVLDVYDYFVHPEFTDQVTLATVALVRLHRWVVGWRSAPVAPICLPLKGFGSLDSIHVAKFSDAKKELQKEMLLVNYVEKKNCADFYYRNGLSLKSMAPVDPLCTVQRGRNDMCLWEAGSVLITKLDYAYWTLLGFGVKGPGCGAPARFTAIHRLMEWLDVATSRGPVQARRRSGGAGDRGRKLAIRQFSPYILTLYDADVTLPTAYGQCERRTRGNIQYKDEAILGSSAAFGLGVYFLEIKTIAQFTCAQVYMRVAARTEAALWVEHDCVRQTTGLAIGITEGPTLERDTCYVYFRTTAYVEFRFRFSSKATITLIIYGFVPPYAPIDPWPQHITSTDAWRPTATQLTIKHRSFMPWFWSMRGE